MKWKDVTRQQLARMEAQAMNKPKGLPLWKRLNEWVENHTGLMLIIATLIASILVFSAVIIPMKNLSDSYTGKMNTAPCQEFRGWTVENLPARCLAEFKAHG